MTSALSSHEDDQTKAAGHKMLDESDQWLLFTITKNADGRLGYMDGLGKMTMVGLLEFELFRMKTDISQELSDVNDEEE